VRQLTCTGPGAIDWLEVPDPELTSTTDAIVRPIVVARCGIDPTLVGIGPTRGDRFALGHEAVAEVVAVAAAVSNVKVGALALPSFWISCGSCDQCTRGKTALCTEYPLLSSYGMEPLSGVEYGGMLSDLVRVPHADTMLMLLPPGVDPIAVASLPDNVVDGFRLVAPHLERRPGADVVIASHGGGAIGLYAAQTAAAFGAGSVTVASDDDTVLDLATHIGVRPLRVDFTQRPPRTWAIVVDCGPEDFRVGFQWSIRATEPEASSIAWAASIPTCPSILRRLYTLGIEFHIGRAHSAALMPQVMALVADGRLHPELITTDIIGWEEVPTRYLDPGVKLIVERSA
jgi:threonine dehydrogenase-like Zn-dependent dehydrogenase